MVTGVFNGHQRGQGQPGSYAQERPGAGQPMKGTNDSPLRGEIDEFILRKKTPHCRIRLIAASTYKLRNNDNRRSDNDNDNDNDNDYDNDRKDDDNRVPIERTDRNKGCRPR